MAICGPLTIADVESQETSTTTICIKSQLYKVLYTLHPFFVQKSKYKSKEIIQRKKLKQ